MPIDPKDVNAATASLLAELGLEQRHPLPEDAAGEHDVDRMLAADEYLRAKSDLVAKEREQPPPQGFVGFFRIPPDEQPLPRMDSFFSDGFGDQPRSQPKSPAEIQRNMEALYRRLGGKVDIYGRRISNEPRRDRRR